MSRLLKQGQVLTGAVTGTLNNTVNLIQRQLLALKTGNVSGVITNFVDFGLKQFDELRSPLIIVANLLVIIGALNWLGIGLYNKNYISMQFGNVTARSLFIAVGIAGIYLIYVKYINYKRVTKKEQFEDLSDEQRILIKAKVSEMRKAALMSGATPQEMQNINAQIRDIEQQYGILESYDNTAGLVTSNPMYGTMYESFDNEDDMMKQNYTENFDNEDNMMRQNYTENFDNQSDNQSDIVEQKTNYTENFQATSAADQPKKKQWWKE